MTKSLQNKTLTDKQREFVKLWVESSGQMSKTDCAIAAGYDEKSAYQRGYELTSPRHCPHVVAEIAKYRDEYLEKYEVTPANHVQILAKIRDKALDEKMYGVAARCEELRGKAKGLYIEKQMNVNKNLEDLSEEELDARMAKILDDWKDVINEGEANDKSKED